VKCGLYHVAPLERRVFYYCLDLFAGKNLVDRADSYQSCSPDRRNADPAWEAVRSKNECLERKSVLWPSGRYRMWESGQNTVAQERTTKSIFYIGYRKEEHFVGTRSLSCVHTTGALHCTERNHMKWVLGVDSLEKSRRCLLSKAWEGTVRLRNCKEGAFRWTQTQLWGGWVVKDCHVQRRKVGMGAPDAFRKRRTSVTGPYLRTTKRNLKRLQELC